MTEIDIEQLTTLAIGSARGKRSEPLFAAYERDLNAGDVELILAPPPKGITTKPLAKLRSTHHFLARLLAEGRKNEECSVITGYSPSRISILKNDPAFQELLSYYATQTEVRYLDVHERLAALGMSTIEELQERLENDPGSLKNRELMELAEFALDRSLTKEARKQGPGGGAPPAISVTFIAAPEPSAPSLPPSRPIAIEGSFDE